MGYKTINISLPASMKSQIEKEISQGHFASTSDFVRNLIRDYLEEKRIEKLLVEGLNDSNISELTPKDFKDLKKEIFAKVKIDLTKIPL